MSEKNFKNASDKPVGFWDFKKNPVFEGFFFKEEQLQKDGKVDLVYLFKEEKSGLMYWLNKNKSIDEGLDAVIVDEVKADKKAGIEAAPALKLKETTNLIRISHIGVIKIKGNRTFNKYAVQYCEM